jgi:undecaprenyl-diphosphatase
LDYVSAVILGLVEGLTEFIPVSSTGHLILVGSVLKFEGARASTFEIFIQMGAILAVALLYRDRILGLLDFRKSEGLTGWNGLGKLALTTAPVLLFGAIFHDLIKTRLFNPLTVAIGLGVGGLAILVVEGMKPKSLHFSLDSITWRDAILVGLFQCLALWPGVSRAAATILGGMLIGLERKTAAEYSFLAAVPALFAAGLYDLYKNLSLLQLSDTVIFGIGTLIAFISAWFAVKFFLRLLSTRNLVPFGWYRIAISFVIITFLR